MSFWSSWNRPAALLDPAPDVEAELAVPFDGPLGDIPGAKGRWPLNRQEVYKIFGNPGVNKPDPAWERANMVSAKNLPGRWNKGAGKLYVHKLAEPYLREALRRCRLLSLPKEEHYPLDYITRLGCFSFRHQRHDTARPLSYHSWGIAVDINSSDNAGKYIKNPPTPFTAEWRKLYPNGVPSDLVRAFESVGWKWGGRWSNYVDSMHFCLVNG